MKYKTYRPISSWLNWVSKKPKLLLHACCGPCGSQISGDLKNNYRVSLFFFNPNIDSSQEHSLREQQIKKIARHWHLPAIIAEYDHDLWLVKIKGLEAEPERGARCPVCFALRLSETARLAKKRGDDCFSTTLSVSPHKNFAQILALGEKLARDYGLKFLDTDFKKQAGYQRSIAKAKQLDLYRQEYCGCEYSR